MNGRIKPSAASVQQRSRTNDAVFTGWQTVKSGEVFALYNVTAAHHPSFGSTLTETGLRKLDLRIPWTPVPPGILKKF